MPTLRPLANFLQKFSRLLVQEKVNRGQADTWLPAAYWQLLLVTIPLVLFVGHSLHYVPEMVDDAYITEVAPVL